MTQHTGIADAGSPSWVRWTAALFGIATVGFLVQGINRAYIATQLGAADGTYSVEYVAKTTQSILAALVCLTAATLPTLWWNLTHSRTQRVATEPLTGQRTPPGR
jgi:hypothetical protein